MNELESRPLSGAHAAYAYRNGVLAHVSQVERGSACSCFCVACNGRLIAKKGPKRIHHFAHAGGLECVGGAETALHLAAKEAIRGLANIYVPPYRFSRSTRLRNGTVVTTQAMVEPATGGQVDISSVALEAVIGNIRADALIQCRSRQLILEVVVTHGVNHAKEKKLRAINLPAIALNLNAQDGLLSQPQLAKLIAKGRENKAWIFHPSQRDLEAKHFLRCRTTASRERAQRAALERKRLERTRKWRSRDKNAPITWSARGHKDRHLPPRPRGSMTELEWDRWANTYFKQNGVWPPIDAVRRQGGSSN